MTSILPHRHSLFKVGFTGRVHYFYDALGNVNGVLDSGGRYYRWEMDAFGNDLPGGNAFLPMDQPGPKEHLTGKMFDTASGLYYFAARWYDPTVGRFVSSDPHSTGGNGSSTSGCPNNGAGTPIVPLNVRLSQISGVEHLNRYSYCLNNPILYVDPAGKWSVDADICWPTQFIIGPCLHAQLGCNPGGGCCWFKFAVGLGVGAGISVDPMGTHTCPAVGCGNCLGLTAECRGAVTLLVAAIGAEIGVTDPFFCTVSGVPVPPGMSTRGVIGGWFTYGARVIAYCGVGFAVFWW